jgi:two-component system cell cycle response regulator DivK
MSSEAILVVDDTPVNLKLTQLVLAGQGYSVTTAPSAEAALHALGQFHPELILADVLLPGIDGLEMTRRIKSDHRTSDIKVVALTAFATQADREKALAAGCDDYIAKPIDTRTLGSKLREILDRRPEGRSDTPPQSAPAPGLILSDAELPDLQLRFLNEGSSQCRQLLDSLGAAFMLEQAQNLAHQWIGSAGLFGYDDISGAAIKLDRLLSDKGAATSAIRDHLTDLAMAFTARLREKDLSVPEHIGQTLNGKRIALIGFSPEYAERTCPCLEGVGARPRLFEITEDPECEAVQICEIALVHVRPETIGSPWLDGGNPLPSTLVLTGTREDLVELDPAIQKRSEDFLMDDWQPLELLMRLSRAASRHAAESSGAEAPPIADAPPADAGPAAASMAVVLADDDPLIRNLVARSLRNFGMTCTSAANGRDALRLIREEHPRVAVLDVNMPELDGYGVLKEIRSENLPVRVILLTARQREEDILKGFMMGVDDYVSKPFNTVELTARVKRLLQ